MAFSGLSKVVGLEPTLALQLHPQGMDKRAGQYFDDEEMSLAFLTGKKCLLTTVPWDQSQVEGTQLLSIPLNSFLGQQDGDVGLLNLFWINQFIFFNCDFKFTIQAVKTRFQSGRLQATVAYGAPGISATDRNLYFNNVLNFTPEEKMASFVVQYNTSVDWLRTYEGPAQNDVDQDYSLGFLNLFVANQLKVTTTVSDTIQLLVFVEIVNTRVAVPRPFSFYGVGPVFGDNNTQVVDPPEPPPLEDVQPTFYAQGPVDPNIPQDQVEGDTIDPVLVPTVTEPTTKTVPQSPCRLNLGEKFEYEPTSVLDLARRPTIVRLPTVIRESSADVGSRSFQIGVEPHQVWANFYAGWAGSLKYRIFLQNNTDQPGQYLTTPVMFMPIAGKTAGMLETNVFLEHLFAPQITAGGGTSISVQVDGTFGLPKAQEQLFPIGGTGYIDVQVPFQTIYNYIMTNHPSDGIGVYTMTGKIVGRIVYTQPLNDALATNLVYLSVGDDFSYGIFRPPSKIRISTVVYQPDVPFELRDIGGWRAVNT
jgi:hypothetical protein